MIEPVQILVEDVTASPLEGASVLVLKDDDVTIVAGGVTGALGILNFNVPAPGNYKARVTMSRVILPDCRSFYVPDTGGTGPGPLITVIGSVPIITDATQPDLCLLFGYMVDGEGAPLQGATVFIETLGKNSANAYVEGGGTGIDANLVHVMPSKREYRTDQAGYWGAQLVRGSTVKVSIPHARFEKIVTVPLQEMAANIKDVRPVLGNQDVGLTSDVPATNAFSGNG